MCHQLRLVNQPGSLKLAFSELLTDPTFSFQSALVVCEDFASQNQYQQSNGETTFCFTPELD